MDKHNIRWIQRLNNFKKAFKQLELGVEQATDRNKILHTYDEETPDEIFHDIVNKYYPAFRSLKEALEKEQQKRAE